MCKLIIFWSDIGSELLGDIFPQIHTCNPSLAAGCSWLWHFCERGSQESSGSGSTVDHEQSPGRWSGIWLNVWNRKQRTNTGSAGRSWRWNRSEATQRRGGSGCGSKSKLHDKPSFLNTNTLQTISTTWKSPRPGPANQNVKDWWISEFGEKYVNEIIKTHCV